MSNLWLQLLQHNQNKQYVSLSDCFTSILIYCNLKTNSTIIEGAIKDLLKKKNFCGIPVRYLFGYFIGRLLSCRLILLVIQTLLIWIRYWIREIIICFLAYTTHLKVFLQWEPELSKTWQMESMMQSLPLSHNEQWHENMTVKLTKS